MQKPAFNQQESTSHNDNNPPESERRSRERRKVTCEGYVYIPVVGWYCRREKTRRGENAVE